MSVTRFGKTIVDVQNLLIQVRTDAGIGPTLVDNVSFQLRQGEVLGLIGESGAGKSTIGLATLGYTRGNCYMTGGKVIFQGKDIREMKVSERAGIRGRGVAYIAQSAAASFNPTMTLYDQICEIPVLQGLLTKENARDEAVKLFRALELPRPETFGERYPHQVSGGQLQRAMAAMAMITKPDLLVFDEPTTALDVTTQVEVLASFKHLIRENGTAAIYITHDLAVVAQISDNIMVLRHGKMVEYGSAVQILQAPKEEYTRRLVAEHNMHGTFAVNTTKSDIPLLSVEAVTASYSSLAKVVDNISLEVRSRDTVAVVGESGSGKSTMARVITGLLPREAGDIKFEGKSLPTRLKDRSFDQLRRIQMIYQMPDVALNPRQTLNEIIGRPVQFYFKRSAAEARVRVKELLRQIDLPEDFIDRYPAQLSGGQKQRVSIARALAAEPDLIICDEVTSALDQLVGEEILKLLKSLQDKLGLAYLFITHDLGTVRRIANKVAVMQQGKLVTWGDTETVFSPPFHPYTEILLTSVPEMRPDWLDDLLAKRKAVA